MLLKDSLFLVPGPAKPDGVPTLHDTRVAPEDENTAVIKSASHPCPLPEGEEGKKHLWHFFTVTNTLRRLALARQDHRQLLDWNRDLPRPASCRKVPPRVWRRHSALLSLRAANRGLDL